MHMCVYKDQKDRTPKCAAVINGDKLNRVSTKNSLLGAVFTRGLQSENHHFQKQTSQSVDGRKKPYQIGPYCSRCMLFAGTSHCLPYFRLLVEYTRAD